MVIKKVKYLLISLIMILPLLTISSYAISTQFPISESDNSAADLSKSFDFKKLKEESSRDLIDCFDINEQGMYAIGNRAFNSATMSLYSETGEFLFGYAFKISGSFVLELEETCLNVYIVRDDLLFSFDFSGNLVGTWQIESTPESTNYMMYDLDANPKQVGDITYRLENDLGLSNFLALYFSRLVKVNPDGTEVVLYQANLLQSSAFIGVLLFLIFFVTCFALTVIQFVRKKKQ